MKQTAISLPDIYIDEVKEYARKGYSPSRIANLLGFGKYERMLFLERISSPDDVYHVGYIQAFEEGQDDIDKALKEKADKGDLEAIKLLAERENERRIKELRQELFGV